MNEIPEVIKNFFDSMAEDGYFVELSTTECYFIAKDKMANIEIKEESLNSFIDSIQNVYEVEFEPYFMNQWWSTRGKGNNFSKRILSEFLYILKSNKGS